MPVQVNKPHKPPYRLTAVAMVVVAVVIFALVYGQFRGDFTPKTKLTMLASRAGLVMDPGSKVTYNGVQIGLVANIARRSTTASRRRSSPWTSIRGICI